MNFRGWKIRSKFMLKLCTLITQTLHIKTDFTCRIHDKVLRRHISHDLTLCNTYRTIPLKDCTLEDYRTGDRLRGTPDQKFLITTEFHRQEQFFISIVMTYIDGDVGILVPLLPELCVIHYPIMTYQNLKDRFRL